MFLLFLGGYFLGRSLYFNFTYLFINIFSNYFFGRVETTVFRFLMNIHKVIDIPPQKPGSRDILSGESEVSVRDGFNKNSSRQKEMSLAP